MKYSAEDYLSAQLFLDRDIEIRCATKRIVTTRTEHRCAFADALGKPHQIAQGTQALYERAIVEGAWGASHSCLTCIDVWLDEIKRGGD